MGAPQPLLHSARSTRPFRIAFRLALVLLAMLGGTLLLPTAYAQTPQVSLVTLVTDQTPLNLSNHFGVPNNSIVNQNGDYAFVGEGYGDIGGHGEGSALFLRRAGASAATRLLQFGDPVPGIAGATAVEFNVGGLNSSGHLLFRVDYTVSPPDGQLHRAFLIYDGVSTYRTVVSSDSVAPGSGQKIGPDLSCTGTCLDNNDDVVFSTDFEPFAGTDTVPNLITYYIAPAGGTPVRVVGLGDAVPGVSGWSFTFKYGAPRNLMPSVNSFSPVNLSTVRPRSTVYSWDPHPALLRWSPPVTRSPVEGPSHPRAACPQIQASLTIRAKLPSSILPH